MRVRRLGQVDYRETFAAMRRFTDARTVETPDELWVVEHPPVYTLGLAGKREHLLRATDIPVVQTDRGGQVTYHGPGQVVVYILVDLRRANLKVRELVHAIEAAVIETLAAYNLAGLRKDGAPGIYVAPVAHERRAAVASGAAAIATVDVVDRGAPEKIAALGLKIRNSCSYHGVSLNVAMDLTSFTWINPCGYAGLVTTDLASHGVAVAKDEVARRLTLALARQFGQTLEEVA